MDESEPRLYEDIQDYEAAKALFQEVIDTARIFQLFYLSNLFLLVCANVKLRQEIPLKSVGKIKPLWSSCDWQSGLRNSFSDNANL
jgi:hypothetical protein